MSEVRLFAKTLWGFWQVKLTSGFFIAFLVLGQIFVRTMPWWVYAGIASITLVVSCFAAWRVEHRGSISLAAEKEALIEALANEAKKTEQAKSELSDHKANNLTVDEIVLREARSGFRTLDRMHHGPLDPRLFLNTTWIRRTAEKYGKTAEEINAAIDRLDGKFHWQ